MKNALKVAALLLFLVTVFPVKGLAQKFIHPGIDQTEADMGYMKKQVLAGIQPWKDAFERLRAGTDTSSEVKPFAHVQRGPYGKPNIGGGELSRDANLAYDCSILWYITDNKAYAEKAIDILNKWSTVLRDFDYNDAKLLAGWTGHLLCNAAEILRYTNSGWGRTDIDNFSNMMMTVYYPLLRYYFPQANGNWDGAIIHSILDIAVFTDNRMMFNNAIDHFLHGPVNGSLFKYIYPSGQCQESTRDQGHVQLGLGEFAGAAKVAFTQGVDLFSIGNNRIALGYEYTAGFLMGQKPQCYGIISERAKGLRDDYEYVYRHYASEGIILPCTKRAADSIRSKATRSVLTAFRAPSEKPVENQKFLKISTIGYPAGAGDTARKEPSARLLYVNPGESIQKALDLASETGGCVIAKAGIHTLPGTLKVLSGVTLAGEGLATILFLDPASGFRDAVVNGDSELHDVTIRDLVIEGNTKTDYGPDPNSTRSYHNTGNRGGIVFLAAAGKELKNLNLINVSVRNCTYNGIFINRAVNVNIDCCDINENGSSVVPGPRLQHNLLLTHCNGVTIIDCRLDTSPYGSGLLLDHCRNARITNCEVARNADNGIHLAECSDITISGNLIEANDKSGILAEYLYYSSENVTINNNLIQYNNGYGVESYAVRGITVSGNRYAGNGSTQSQQKLSNKKYIIMR
jgi:parallel beta-helix repeat protein